MTGKTLVGPGGVIERTKHSTPPAGKRLVFGVGMVDAAEAERLMGKKPGKTQQEVVTEFLQGGRSATLPERPEVTVTKARIVPTRNGVVAVPISDPEPEVVANTAAPAAAPATNKTPDSAMKQPRLVFGLSKPKTKTKKRPPAAPAPGLFAPAQMSLFG